MQILVILITLFYKSDEHLESVGSDQIGFNT